MSNFKKVLDAVAIEAEDMSDEELLADERMLAERPDEFRQRYRFLLSAFSDNPDLEPTIQNGIRLGARLVSDPRFRRAMIKLAMAENFRYEQDEAGQSIN
jgi:hypothetical protein